jgi:hypothetical protein
LLKSKSVNTPGAADIGNVIEVNPIADAVAPAPTPSPSGGDNNNNNSNNSNNSDGAT